MSTYFKSSSLKNAGVVVLLMVSVCIGSRAQELTKITMVRNLPLVKGMINNKEAYFILDTGASVTLLNEGLAEEFGFDVVQNEYWENYVVSGLGGKHLIREARHVTVFLGGQTLAFINKTCSLQRISKNFAAQNIRIAGIIGSDVMGFLGSEINFSSGYVVFYHEPVKKVLTVLECRQVPEKYTALEMDWK